MAKSNLLLKILVASAFISGVSGCAPKYSTPHYLDRISDKNSFFFTKKDRFGREVEYKKDEKGNLWVRYNCGNEKWIRDYSYEAILNTITNAKSNTSTKTKEAEKEIK